MSFIVGIDGPAGSGKGTVTKKIANILNLTTIDTGSTYRCVALEVLNQKIDTTNIVGLHTMQPLQIPQNDENMKLKNEIIKIAGEIKIEIKNDNKIDRVFLNGEEVTEKIRSKEVTAIVSPISSITEVRIKMVELQRKLAEGKNIIMEGRDICTYVFPNADVKIYLDATIEERATRRYKENQEKGIDTTYEEVVENITSRDYNDMHKEIGSLKQAEGSIYVDSTGLTADEVVEKIVNIIRRGGFPYPPKSQQKGDF